MESRPKPSPLVTRPTLRSCHQVKFPQVPKTAQEGSCHPPRLSRVYSNCNELASEMGCCLTAGKLHGDYKTLGLQAAQSRS